MFASTYPAGGGTAFDISVGVKVWRQLAFGAGVALFSRQDELQVTAQLPHPFHFDQPRRITGTAQGLTRAETAGHVQATWVAPVGQRPPRRTSGHNGARRVIVSTSFTSSR